MRNIGIKTIRLFCVSFIVFLAAFRPANAGPNDPVNIPDANLRAVLETALGKAAGDPITEAEMASFTGNQGNSLSVSSKVSDLTGLQYATGVTRMSFSHQIQVMHNGRRVTVTENDIRDLSPLRNLTQLEFLNILHRDLTNISPLENLTELKELTLWRRNTSPPSSALALTSLAGLTKLTYLFLSNNNVEDISPLRGLTALTNLILNDNRIVDISPLRDLTALKQLQLGFNEITDISPLSSLTNLEDLHLRHNVALSDISHLRYLTKLKELWLHNTSITPSGLGGVLPFLGSLKRLILQITRISDLSVLDRFPADVSLAVLDLRYIGSLDRDVAWLLTDITPLVGFVASGKMGPDSLFPGSPRIELKWNLGLDYESIYTDLPALINGLSGGSVEYYNSQPALEAEDQVGHPGARYTFVVRTVNNTTIGSRTFQNRGFEKVPVTFTVTGPDGSSQMMAPVETDSDGLASVSFRLGRHGETHTVEAVVPAKTTSVSEIQHPELRVTFTITADRTVPPPRGPGNPDGLTVTFLDYPQENPIDEFSLTIEFSEPVIGFEKEDITLQTKLTTGKGVATLTTLTPQTPIHADSPAPDPIQTYTATVQLPDAAGGTVRLIVGKDAATTPATATLEKTGPSSDTASDFIDFGPALDEDARFRHPPALVVTHIDFTKGSFSVQNTTQYRFNIEMRIYSEDHKDKWFRISERDLITIEDAETLTFSLTPVEIDDASIIHLNSERLLNQNQHQPLKLSAEKFCIKLMRVIPVDTASNMNEDFRVKETRWDTPGDVIYRQYDASWDAKLQGLRRDHLPYYRFPLAGQLSDSWDVEASVIAGPPVSAVFVPQLENAQITKPTRRKADVNGDGTVNTADLVLITSNFGKTGQNAADVNSDGVVNIADFVLAAGALDANAAAPSLFSQTVSTLTVTDVRLWLSQAQHLTLTDATSQRGLLFLEQLLVALTPKETALLPNYPNPFNPETWIPYQLAKDAEVTLDIYNVQGLLVRQLKLGHQAAGIYRSRARAAHWDGQNQLGEKVASGLYFYTFTADGFTDTQKLLIRK